MLKVPDVKSVPQTAEALVLRNAAVLPIVAAGAAMPASQPVSTRSERVLSPTVSPTATPSRVLTVVSARGQGNAATGETLVSAAGTALPAADSQGTFGNFLTGGVGTPASVSATTTTAIGPATSATGPSFGLGAAAADGAQTGLNTLRRDQFAAFGAKVQELRNNDALKNYDGMLDVLGFALETNQDGELNLQQLALFYAVGNQGASSSFDSDAGQIVAVGQAVNILSARPSATDAEVNALAVANEFETLVQGLKVLAALQKDPNGFNVDELIDVLKKMEDPEMLARMMQQAGLTPAQRRVVEWVKKVLAAKAETEMNPHQRRIRNVMFKMGLIDKNARILSKNGMLQKILLALLSTQSTTDEEMQIEMALILSSAPGIPAEAMGYLDEMRARLAKEMNWQQTAVGAPSMGPKATVSAANSSSRWIARYAERPGVTFGQLQSYAKAGDQSEWNAFKGSSGIGGSAAQKALHLAAQIEGNPDFADAWDMLKGLQVSVMVDAEAFSEQVSKVAGVDEEQRLALDEEKVDQTLAAIAKNLIRLYGDKGKQSKIVKLLKAARMQGLGTAELAILLRAIRSSLDMQVRAEINGLISEDDMTRKESRQAVVRLVDAELLTKADGSFDHAKLAQMRSQNTKIIVGVFGENVPKWVGESVEGVDSVVTSESMAELNKKINDLKTALSSHEGVSDVRVYVSVSAEAWSQNKGIFQNMAAVQSNLLLAIVAGNTTILASDAIAQLMEINGGVLPESLQGIQEQKNVRFIEENLSDGAAMQAIDNMLQSLKEAQKKA